MGNPTQYLLATTMLLLFCMCGCQGGADPDAMLARATDNNVKRVSRMYTVFQMRNSMIGPKDEEELKSFILEHSEARLARIGIDPEKVDEIFLSERDGQKLIVRYGTELEDSSKSIPVVFEAEGKDGTRYVGFSNAYMQEISDDDQYKRLMAGEEDNKVVDENHA
jgi:hypothetical protein